MSTTEQLTIELAVTNGDRCKRMRKVLTDQTSITVARFEEKKQKEFTNFKVTCISYYAIYQLGLAVGREQIFSQIKFE